MVFLKDRPISSDFSYYKKESPPVWLPKHKEMTQFVKS